MSSAMSPTTMPTLKSALDSLASLLAGAYRAMPRKKATPQETFGRRLARIRRARGLTQPELAKKIGISGRMLAYYEAQTEHVPAHLLGKLSGVLAVPTDELLGAQPLRTVSTEAPENLRFWRRLRVAETLPPSDRKAILDHLDALIAKRKLRQAS